MTDCIREQVMAAAKTVLDGITGITGLKVYRNRDAAVSARTALVLYEGNQQADHELPNQIRYTMTLNLEGIVKPASDNLGSEINNLYAKAIQALVADYTLGGLTVDVKEISTDFEVLQQEGMQPAATFLSRIEVMYFTRDNDPFTIGP